MLADVLILEVGTHCDLSLKSSIADGAVVWQGLCMRCEMFRQVVLAKESINEQRVGGRRIEYGSAYKSQLQGS